MVCLFLLGFAMASRAQDFKFERSVQEAYDLALQLRIEAALEKLHDQGSVGATYVASLAEAIELLVSEDPTKFSRYEDRFQKRLDKQQKGDGPHDQFLQAEIRLHWAFVYLKFGHELDAALHLRQAYQTAVSCREKFPDYFPIRKTTGLLEIIIGSVPDKYDWLLSLLNMRGSVTAGLDDLKLVGNSGSPFSLEGKLLYALVEGFILSDPASALSKMQTALDGHKANPLALFFSASLALKNSQNELALKVLNELTESNGGMALYYADYLRGEAYLHKGDYINAMSSYRWFISHQTGQNYIKDAWYKIGLCYWLNGNRADADAVFEEARNKGKEVTEADKSAARALAEKEPPNIRLSRVRYFTDGGYYTEAEEALALVSKADLPSLRDQVEYYYRKARLAHKVNKAGATELYLKTVEMTGDENWYFAPNACLQLGYIYQAQGRVAEAEDYFRRALSYRRHEYKNSIDSKARSALAQLGRM